jgi:hypothetical protein
VRSKRKFIIQAILFLIIFVIFNLFLIFNFFLVFFATQVFQVGGDISVTLFILVIFFLRVVRVIIGFGIASDI